MPRSTGGDKRSSWLTFHRRLFLVRRLIRSPADAATLIADARDFFGVDAEIYPPDARAALRHDLAALRDEFECAIQLDDQRRYALEDLGRLALLDLPDADLEALAFLLANFNEGPLPNAPQVDALLDRIIALLPPDRRAQLGRPARDVRFDLPLPAGAPNEHTLRQIKRALRRQQISFGYRSSYTEGAALVQHRVAPYDLLFRDGHHYLDAFCHDCGMAEFGQRYRLYRLDRIAEASVRLLPDQLPPSAPPRPVYRLRYLLSPGVARQRDIALWFPHSQVEFLPDGGARITARTTDLWQARQILLRYREHCRVFEPAELAAMLRESAERVARMYQAGDEPADDAEIV